MALQQLLESEGPRAPDEARARQPELLIDQFLPRCDLAVVHAEVLRAQPEVCYRAARNLDLLREPIIRTLLEVRTAPQRLADRLCRHHGAASADASMRTFRMDDMVRPPISWTLLGEVAGTEMVLGQIGRPWRSMQMGTGPNVAPESAAFDQQGFAKIALNPRVQPCSAARSTLALERCDREPNTRNKSVAQTI